MSRPTRVAPWKTRDELLAWLKEASTKGEYQRRLVIWMAVVQPMPAVNVAEALGISMQAVWKWTSEYNRLGPDGLDRIGRGGRRRALLSLSAERALVVKVRALQSREPRPSLRSLLPEVRRTVRREVPLHYLYRLMTRWQTGEPEN
jgi:transposase